MYRPIDVLTVQRRGERERRAVHSRAGRFLGRGVPHTFSHPVAALTRPTFLSHTHSTHQKIKKMFEQEIEVEDINASDSKGRSSTHKPKYVPPLNPCPCWPINGWPGALLDPRVWPGWL